MDPQELAEWIRKEHERIEVLLEDAREKIAIVPRTNQKNWLFELRDCVEHIRAHIQKHMALEEHNGYLAEVLDRRPTLAASVEKLRCEHSALTRIVDRIFADLKETTPEDQLLIRDCCRRIGHFLDDVKHHEGDENLLVLSVFSRDLGAED